MEANKSYDFVSMYSIMQNSVRDDSNTTLRMYSIANKQRMNLLEPSRIDVSISEGTGPHSKRRQTVTRDRANDQTKSSEQMNNMLNTLKEYENDSENISFYDQTLALKKNSVIDRLLIDQTLAEKKEEYDMKNRKVKQNSG